MAVSLRVLSTMALALAIAWTPSSAQSPEDELIGLYNHGTNFGPMVQGEITIVHADGVWRATFAGLEAKVKADGKALSVVFPQGVGMFRGALAADSRSIHGFWVRPGVTDDPRYPGGSSQ